MSSLTNGIDRPTHSCSASNSGDGLSDRPLPSIPLPSPPSQAHIISPSDLIGFNDGSATKLGQVCLTVSITNFSRYDLVT